MTIRSKLFATVALPVFAASLAVQPALADSLKAPFEVAQEGGEELSPEELLLLKKREQEQRKAEEEQQRAAEEEKQRAAEEEQQRAAEEEKQRAAEEEQQRAAEEEKQRAAEEEQQRAAEEDKQRAAEEEQQRAAEEEKQRAAEEEQQRAAEEEKQRAAEEEQQRAAEEEKQRAAEEEKQRAAEEEQQRAAEEEQQRAAEEEKQRAAEEEKQRAAEEEQQRAAEEEQQRAAEEEQQRQAEEEQTAEEPPAATEDKTTAEQPPAEEPAEQTGEAEQQPVPEGEEPATAEQMQAEQPEGQPAPEVVDERTVEEKQKIAEDPAASDETVVLPVEGGAAVLDSDKDADNAGGNRSRELRRQQREELRAKEEIVAPPADDAAAQAEIPAEFTEGLPQKVEAALSEEGQRVEAAPTFAVPETTNIVNNTMVNNTVINNTTVNNTTTNNVTEVRVVEETENRVILEAGDRIFVRGDDRPRLRRDAEETFYEELPRGRYRETIVRPDGYRVVTIYNRYGDILQRTRIDRDGNDYVLIYAPEYEERRRPAIVDVGYELPPMRLTIPVDDYIVDYAEEPDRDYYEFLSEPPVERVERVYTMDEVRHSARLRDKVRRVDLDTITFATGSAEVSMSQAKTLRRVADAMAKILERDPGETFFIEGHTDAVGSDRSNLLLSDKRADSVATLLSEVYGIAPENLVTQGYGERFLKIRTQEAEQENRRVTIRRVTPLVRPVAQR
ncbi:OmpA family protein [Ensifer sp. NBAIM29]|nr:OmpA family protein [Ensifer sp. NBAIM29]